jgi:hypothetical protein
MDTQMNCCQRCQVFWTCETKWYRGEKGEENLCCSTCNFYRECLKKSKEKKEKEKN